MQIGERLHDALQWEANHLRRVFEWELWRTGVFKGAKHCITCESRDYFSIGISGNLRGVRVWRPWRQREEICALIEVKRWRAHTNKATERDGVHRILIWKGRKKGQKTSGFVLLDRERTKECIETVYSANLFWKLSKRKGEPERTTSSVFLILAIFN